MTKSKSHNKSANPDPVDRSKLRNRHSRKPSMFTELRNHLIFVNVFTTTVILVLAGTIIYNIAINLAGSRPTYDQSLYEYTDDVEGILRENIDRERRQSAQSLLSLLITTGISVEIVVVIFSYFFAEEAIRPVKRAYESQKLFIANASHEIKTPIAAISANLEAADLSNNKWIKNVERETEKLAHINGELLTLARSDIVTESSAKPEEVDIAELVRSELETFEPRLKNKALEKSIPRTLKTKLNSADFKEILSILLDNAAKYSDQKINLELDKNSLSIKNDGATIEPAKISHVFDRFYQTDKTRDGVGLGLSIAKSLADRNHWTLSAASDADSTAFTLKF